MRTDSTNLCQVPFYTRLQIRIPEVRIELSTDQKLTFLHLQKWEMRGFKSACENRMETEDFPEELSTTS
jgi:hypothetical protein